MDKKDIYEHLAKIYLDASSKRKKRKKVYPGFFKNIYFISIVFLFVSSAVLFQVFKKNKIFNSEITLVLLSDAAKLNFNFNPAKKEVFSLVLNKLNLKRFRELGFSVKKANYKDSISLRVEFANAFNEKSEAYFKDISSKWQDYRINLSDFKSINDWSQVVSLSFIVEEWNTREKAGVVYIDNVRFLR